MTLGEKVQSILQNLHWLTDEELKELETACGAELQERYRQEDEGRGTLAGNHPAPTSTSLSSLDGGQRTVKCAVCTVEIDPQAAWGLDDGRKVCRWCIEERFKLPELQALSGFKDE
jgi:hypothetical protein